jgi:hypothetical protein
MALALQEMGGFASRRIAKILRAVVKEGAMSAQSQLVLNIGRVPEAVASRRDALALAMVECGGRRVAGTECLCCPRLVFWMTAPERGCLKLFCRRP